jgi:hypothetical protein
MNIPMKRENKKRVYSQEMQFTLIKSNAPFFGGDLPIGKRKVLRPLARKRPIHLTLKAKKNLRRTRVMEIIHEQGKKSAIQILDAAPNVDHIHLAILIPSREAYNKFVRAVTGLIAKLLGKGLWKLLPFTRVLNWGKPLQELQRYFQKNRDEPAGLRAYEPRTDWYKRHRPK